MLRPTLGTDPLLGRPLALYDTIDGPDGAPAAFDLVYLVMGRGTQALSRLIEGDLVDLWGPMGNTFPCSRAQANLDHVLLVAGGIGQTPFLSVSKELLGLRRYGSHARADMSPRRMTFLWGARSGSNLAGLEDFQLPGVEVRVATDDGSAGHHGTVMDLARPILDSDDPPTSVFACGPEPMLEALAMATKDRSVPTWVSLETKMACGYGVCFSCVCAVQDAASWDYRRVCLEGPVFNAERIVWHV